MQIITYNDSLKHQVIAFVQGIWHGLGRTVDLEGGERDLADIAHAYQAAGGEFWVVLNDRQEVVGTIGLLRLSQTEGELARLYLDESCRGLGLGRALAQRVVDKAKENGLTLLKLDTSKKLASAYALFQKMGFVTTRDLGDERQTVFMELPLAS